LAVEINGNHGTQRDISVSFQQKFLKKLYHFNRNSQFRIVM